MFLQCVGRTSHIRRLVRSPSIRMSSTVKGASGRVYVQGDVLQRDHRTNEPRIFKAECENQSFVFKRVSESIYNLATQDLSADFAGSRRLRMHVDTNPDERILVYPFYKNTLLNLIQQQPDFPVDERLKILRAVAEGLHEMHGKNWVHLDIKPDNVLVNWTHNEQGNQTTTGAALGDFDLAYKMDDDRPFYGPHAVGNAMWRSPEAQTGRGLGKPSDVYAFGLVVLYTLGAGDLLLLHGHEALAKEKISPEQEVLTRHFSYFGPANEGLLSRVNNEVWSKALVAASKQSQLALEENPMLSFQLWGESLGPAGVDLITSMTKIDPAERKTMDQILEHRWWQGEDE